MKTIFIILSLVLTYSSFAYDYNGLDQFNNIQHNYYAQEFMLDRQAASFYCDPITGKCYFR